MNPRLLLPAILSVLWLPAKAAAFDYDLLIVACNSDSCQRVAEQTVSGRMAETIEFSRNGVQLQIETLASRLNEVDTRIFLKVRPDESLAAALQPSLEKATQRLHTLAEPRTMRQGIFTPLSAFASEGTFYRIWARLAAIR